MTMNKMLNTLMTKKNFLMTLIIIPGPLQGLYLNYPQKFSNIMNYLPIRENLYYKLNQKIRIFPLLRQTWIESFGPKCPDFQGNTIKILDVSYTESRQQYVPLIMHLDIF